MQHEPGNLILKPIIDKNANLTGHCFPRSDVCQTLGSKCTRPVLNVDVEKYFTKYTFSARVHDCAKVPSCGYMWLYIAIFTCVETKTINNKQSMCGQ